VEAVQKTRLAALLAEVQVAILVTQGEQWPTATMQAFAETPEFDLLFIMNDASEKFKNLLEHPHVTVFLDAREKGKVETFEISRVLIQGIAARGPARRRRMGTAQEHISEEESLRSAVLQIPDAAHDARQAKAAILRGCGPLRVQG
jgi:hypothetical protein